jgi:hypothetical protein
MQSMLDRLEARVDYQSARIDAICRALEQRRIRPQPVHARSGDTLFDRPREVTDTRSRRQVRRQRTRCRARFHVGDATGV